MRTHADLRPAPSGYVVDLDNGDRLHVWSDVGIVVAVDATGAPAGIGDMPRAALQVQPSPGTLGFLQWLWDHYANRRRRR